MRQTPPAGSVVPADPRPRLWAALFVLPYLLLSLTWAVSNPPGAAPDEQHHLVKAIGSGSFQVGRAGPPAPADAPATVETRNASIMRIYQIPARLVSGQEYRCFAFEPDVTADCLPDTPPGSGDESVEFETPVGAYPPFLYLPIGWAAAAAETPEQAFVAGRAVVAVLSVLLLWLGVTHAIRWLGRGAVLPFAAALTPMAIYSMSILSVSGIEIASSCAVAAVVAVALRRPESVHVRGTHITLTIAGVALVLGRQLGVAALGLMLIVLLVAAGWTRIRELLRARQPSFVTAVVTIGVATAVVVWWELTYDNPSNTGTVLNGDAVMPFLDRSYGYLVGSIGLFGWLDTRLPGPAIGAWLTIWVVLVASALFLARRRDAVIVGVALAVVWVLGFAIYASVFITVSANIQGRQFLGFTAFVLIVAGAIVLDRLPELGRAVALRVYAATGLVAAGVHVFALYYNARRYAVGTSGPLWFLPDARWSPPGGHTFWLSTAVVAGLLLLVVIVLSRPRPPAGIEPTEGPNEEYDTSPGRPPAAPGAPDEPVPHDSERVGDHVER